MILISFCIKIYKLINYAIANIKKTNKLLISFFATSAIK